MKNNFDQAVILLGRGGYSDAPTQQLDQLVTRVQNTERYSMVTQAMVDQGTPSLLDALQSCADAGIGRILVIPVFMPDDRNLSKWLAKIIRRWLWKREGTEVEVTVSEALGDQDALGNAVVQIAFQNEKTAPLSVEDLRDKKFGDPEWSIIPPHKYHVLTCRGPRCTTLGSGELWQYLADRLEEENLMDKEVLVAQTGCLFPCNLGPMMVIYPEGVWYCGLTEDALDRIVQEHFIEGHVVEEYKRMPASYPQRRPGIVL